jgi:hypothetical protein
MVVAVARPTASYTLWLEASRAGEGRTELEATVRVIDGSTKFGMAAQKV